MKRNFFNEPIAQPGDDYDDFGLPFMELHELENPPEIIGARISDDPNFGWCAEMDTDEGDMIQAQDFESRDSLVFWLTQTIGLTLNQITDDEE